MLQAGVLKPLLNFITGENRDVQRFAIMCLKELCENRENRNDLFEQTPAQPMLDAIFELLNNADPPRYENLLSEYFSIGVTKFSALAHWNPDSWPCSEA